MKDHDPALHRLADLLRPVHYDPDALPEGQRIRAANLARTAGLDIWRPCARCWLLNCRFHDGFERTIREGCQ